MEVNSPWSLSAFILWKIVHQSSTKPLLLCSTEERTSYGFGATWTDDRIFIFGWSISKIILIRLISVLWHPPPETAAGVASKAVRSEQKLTAVWMESFPLGDWFKPSTVSQSSHLRVSFNMFPPSKKQQQMGMRYFQPGYACHLTERILLDSEVFVQFYRVTKQNYKSNSTF